MNMYNPYSYELYHHGILGQKWGVRRYQYEDGSLTPEGRKRYGLGDHIRDFKEKRKEKYVSKKMESGMTREESEEAYEKHKKAVRTALLVVGGVTIAAAVGYAAYKSGQNKTDTMINSNVGNSTLSGSISDNRAIRNNLSNTHGYSRNDDYTKVGEDAYNAGRKYQSMVGRIRSEGNTSTNIPAPPKPPQKLSGSISDNRAIRNNLSNTHGYSRNDDYTKVGEDAYNAGRKYQSMVGRIRSEGNTSTNKYGDSLRNTTKSLSADRSNLAKQAEELRRRNEMLKRSLGK